MHRIHTRIKHLKMIQGEQENKALRQVLLCLQPGDQLLTAKHQGGGWWERQPSSYFTSTGGDCLCSA